MLGGNKLSMFVVVEAAVFHFFYFECVCEHSLLICLNLITY